ncbi:MAG: hypothetical protein ACLPYY_18835 [Acidimicrobiales bacterium]
MVKQVMNARFFLNDPGTDRTPSTHTCRKAFDEPGVKEILDDRQERFQRAVAFSEVAW